MEHAPAGRPPPRPSPPAVPRGTRLRPGGPSFPGRGTTRPTSEASSTGRRSTWNAPHEKAHGPAPTQPCSSPGRHTGRALSPSLPPCPCSTWNTARAAFHVPPADRHRSLALPCPCSTWNTPRGTRTPARLDHAPCSTWNARPRQGPCSQGMEPVRRRTRPSRVPRTVARGTRAQAGFLLPGTPSPRPDGSIPPPGEWHFRWTPHAELPAGFPPPGALVSSDPESARTGRGTAPPPSPAPNPLTGPASPCRGPSRA